MIQSYNLQLPHHIDGKTSKYLPSKELFKKEKALMDIDNSMVIAGGGEYKETNRYWKKNTIKIK